MDGESCTSTDVAVPMTRWFVTTSPFASITNPDARVVGVQSADDAVLPLRAAASADPVSSGVAAAVAARCGAERHDLRVGGRQLEHGVAAGDDIQRLRPLVGLALERDRLDPIPRCSCPGRSRTSTVPSSPVTTRRGDDVAGLSLMSSACRGTGVLFRSASSRPTFI